MFQKNAETLDDWVIGIMIDSMDLHALKDTPPWDWPRDASMMFLKALKDTRSDKADRLLAAELAGDFTVVNDELADALVSVVSSVDESDQLRAKAAISLGPVIENADTDGFDDPDDMPITEDMFLKIQDSLRRLHSDADASKEVRRRALEASVRASQEWHRDAIQAAFAGEDKDWKLTAVFCMQWIGGFERQILQALESEDLEIHYEAVCAAGSWEVDGAWSHVAALISAAGVDKALLLAAIDAVASIRPEEAGKVLVNLTDSEDEDIVEAAYEAMAMADGPADDDYDYEGDITVH